MPERELPISTAPLPLWKPLCQLADTTCDLGKLDMVDIQESPKTFC